MALSRAIQTHGSKCPPPHTFDDYLTQICRVKCNAHIDLSLVSNKGYYLTCNYTPCGIDNNNPGIDTPVFLSLELRIR